MATSSPITTGPVAPPSPSNPQSSTSTSISAPPPQPSPSAPSISLTPATPDTAQNPALPHPASPPRETASTVPAVAEIPETGNMTSGGSASASAPTAAAAAASTTSEKPSVPAGPSTSKPAASTTRPTGQKKKRKRKGFAGLLLALGCLSASEFEDDPKDARKRDTAATEKPGTGSSSRSDVKPATTAPIGKVDEREKQVGEPRRSGEGKSGAGVVGAGAVAAGAGAAVVAGASGSDKKEKADVVLSPSEPVSPPLDETAGVTSSAVQPPGSGSELLHTTPSRPTTIRRESDTGTPSASADKTTSSGGYTELLQSEGTGTSERDDQADHVDGQGEDGEEYGVEEEYEDEEDRLIAQGGIGIPHDEVEDCFPLDIACVLIDQYGRPCPLLPPIDKAHIGRKCLVLDLDETLLHSSFKLLQSADYIVPVEIESQTHNVYVIKRPGVDHFLTEMGKIYEVVVFTASLSKYADPVLDMLDPAGVVKHRLFRESCYNHKGNYVKDLSQLGRAMETCIILDNSPASYIFHPNNAVPVSTWFNDPHDTELADLCPFLTDLAAVDDIRGVLEGLI